MSWSRWLHFNFDGGGWGNPAPLFLGFSMTQWFEQVVQYLDQITGGNEILSAMVGAWLLGVATYLLKNLPKAIYGFFKRQLITTIRIDNGDYTKRAILVRLMKEHRENKLFKFSRKFDFETAYLGGDGGATAHWGLGYGIHWMLSEGRLFWIHKEKAESGNSEIQKYEVKISTFGRDMAPFEPLIGRVNKAKVRGTYVYAYLSGSWLKVAPMRSKSIDSVITQDDVLPKMIETIDVWRESRSEYDARGLDYRLNFLLHGLPGTGKTSIAKALSNHYQMDVYSLDLSTLYSSSITRIFSDMGPKRGFILLIEDFDLNSAVSKRKEGEAVADSGNPQQRKMNLSHILNLLDGVIPLDNIITIMTTNHLSKIDPAVYRKGRVDFLYEIKPLKDDYISRYVERVCGRKEKFKGEVRGCDLQAAYLENRGDTDGFVRAVKKLCKSK